MSKRFTETGKWADPWFRSLSTRHKALWQWLLDNCDCAGVLGEIDWGLVSFQIGETCSEEDMKTFGGRIEPCGKGWWVAKFVAFQVGYVEAETLSKPHRGVLKALAKASIPLHKAMETLSKPLPKGLQTLKDKDKDKDKDKEIVLPEKLNTPEFADAWKDWVAYRKERGQTLKPTTIKAQLATMQDWGAADAVAAIRQSIMNGWQGIFEPRSNGQPKKPGGTSTYELEARAHGYTL
jgi:hypothetical protein